MKEKDLINLIIDCVKTAEDPTHGTINYPVLTTFLKNELPKQFLTKEELEVKEHCFNCG